MSNKTKKYPVSVSYGEEYVKRNEFVIPNIVGEQSGNNFVGIETGDSYLYGAISYIGKEITAKDVIGKIAK
ncbi:MAG: hypothetical protein GY799_16025, partial [Desulfobulbaceae bacterium]|nr:hypothetical protein [Desulfobulbaceae bacterium]